MAPKGKGISGFLDSIIEVPKAIVGGFLGHDSKEEGPTTTLEAVTQPAPTVAPQPAVVTVYQPGVATAPQPAVVTIFQPAVSAMTVAQGAAPNPEATAIAKLRRRKGDRRAYNDPESVNPKVMAPVIAAFATMATLSALPSYALPSNDARALDAPNFPNGNVEARENPPVVPSVASLSTSTLDVYNAPLVASGNHAIRDCGEDCFDGGQSITTSLSVASSALDDTDDPITMITASDARDTSTSLYGNPIAPTSSGRSVPVRRQDDDSAPNPLAYFGSGSDTTFVTSVVGTSGPVFGDMSSFSPDTYPSSSTRSSDDDDDDDDSFNPSKFVFSVWGKGKYHERRIARHEPSSDVQEAASPTSVDASVSAEGEALLRRGGFPTSSVPASTSAESGPITTHEKRRGGGGGGRAGGPGVPAATPRSTPQNKGQTTSHKSTRSSTKSSKTSSRRSTTKSKTSSTAHSTTKSSSKPATTSASKGPKNSLFAGALNLATSLASSIRSPTPTATDHAVEPSSTPDPNNDTYGEDIVGIPKDPKHGSQSSDDQSGSTGTEALPTPTADGSDLGDGQGGAAESTPAATETADLGDGQGGTTGPTDLASSEDAQVTGDSLTDSPLKRRARPSHTTKKSSSSRSITGYLNVPTTSSRGARASLPRYSATTNPYAPSSRSGQGTKTSSKPGSVRTAPTSSPAAPSGAGRQGNADKTGVQSACPKPNMQIREID